MKTASTAKTKNHHRAYLHHEFFPNFFPPFTAKSSPPTSSSRQLIWGQNHATAIVWQCGGVKHYQSQSSGWAVISSSDAGGHNNCKIIEHNRLFHQIMMAQPLLRGVVPLRKHSGAMEEVRGSPMAIPMDWSTHDGGQKKRSPKNCWCKKHINQHHLIRPQCIETLLISIAMEPCVFWYWEEVQTPNFRLANHKNEVEKLCFDHCGKQKLKNTTTNQLQWSQTHRHLYCIKCNDTNWFFRRCKAIEATRPPITFLQSNWTFYDSTDDEKLGKHFQ